MRPANLRSLLTSLFIIFFMPCMGFTQTNASELFGRINKSSSMPSYPYGSYSNGCLAGGVKLPESGPTWQAMRLSRNRNWGHPDTIDYIKRFSEKVAKLPGWKGIYVGDIAQPRGGPMLSGHRSHQTGLDVDFWMLPTNDLKLSRKIREEISSVSLRRANGVAINKNWTVEHHQIFKAAASDPRVARIFVFPGAKIEMCRNEKGDRAWLRKIRPWWGHHYHFHVRLKCPVGHSQCVNQAPPPIGDGCKEAHGWIDRILSPPPRILDAPKQTSRRDLVMAELPNQCVRVLTSK